MGGKRHRNGVFRREKAIFVQGAFNLDFYVVNLVRAGLRSASNPGRIPRPPPSPPPPPPPLTSSTITTGPPFKRKGEEGVRTPRPI